MRIARLSVIPFLALLGCGVGIVIFLLLSAAPAHAGPSCTDSWTSAASGQWTTPGNWSTNAVPTSSDNVCITVAGTYTVTLASSGSAGTLTLGGTSGTQTLDVQGNAASNGQLALSTATGSAINTHGVFVLDAQGGSGPGTGGAYLTGGPGVTLTNSGTFNTEDAGGTDFYYWDYIQANLSNQPGGTVTINGATTDQNSATTTTNKGSFTVTATSALSLTSGGSFTDSGGTLVNNGSMSVEGSGTFTQSGGAESGNAVQLSENTTLADSAGAGSFDIVSTMTVSGTIPSTQTVTVIGDSTETATATLSGTVTNNGTFILDAQGGSGPGTGGAYLGGGSGTTLVNKGTFETEGAKGTDFYYWDYIEANLTNSAGATVTINGATTKQDSATTTTNKGSFTITASASFLLSNNGFFTDSAGTLVDNGTMMVGGVTFTQSGGTESGNPVQLSENATLADSAGAGTFDVVNTMTVTGTIPSTQTITVIGDADSSATITVTGTLTNDGTVVLDAQGGGPNGTGQANISGGNGQTFVNNGLLETEGANTCTYCWDYIGTNVTNDPGGRIDLTGGTNNESSYNLSMNNEGTLTVADGATFNQSAGSTYTQSSTGTFQPTVDGTTNTAYGMSGGTSFSVAGTLAITTVGSPAPGDMYDVISGSPVGGTFTKFSFGPHAYIVGYPAPGNVVQVTVATPFSLAGDSFSATQDIPLTNQTVATITPGSQAGATYTATIDWGDSTTASKATVTGGSSVSGSHTYAHPASDTVTATVTDQYGTTESVTATATVAPAPVPTVTSVSANHIYLRTTDSLTVNGTGFTANGTASIGFSNAGVTLNSLTWKSPTKLTANVSVSPTAPTGSGNVSVTTPGGTGTCTHCLSVTKPPPPSNTALPVITGTDQDGQVLTTTSGTWSSLETLTYAYQWERCSSSDTGCVPIPGATTTYYRLAAADVGGDVSVVVTATDQVAQSTAATATALGPVTDPPAPSNTALPVISGSFEDGQVLTTSEGSWSSPDLLGYGYEWVRCNSVGADCAPIPGATHRYYRLAGADIGNDVTVNVTVTDQEGQGTTVFPSAPAGPIAYPPPPSNTSLPVISGTGQDGQVLTATVGTWSSVDPLVYSYQWVRCNTLGGICVTISQANDSSYGLTAADVGSYVTVNVQASDLGGQDRVASAARLGPITGPPPPTNTVLPAIAGSGQNGQVLTASSGTWSSPDTLGYAYQWVRCTSVGVNCANIAGAANDYYGLTGADVGDVVTVTVTATDQESQSTPVSATPIGPITS